MPDPLTIDQHSPTGAVLASRISAFQTGHPGVTVELRQKTAAGLGGMLESLSAAHQAAPLALPDIVLLGQNDLRAAALQGLILRLSGIVPAPAEPDYFPFAVELSEVEGIFYASAFAGETQVLAYNDFSYPSPPLTWTEVISGTGPFLFPAGESGASFTLTQYLAIGGRLADERGQPALDVPLLAEVLGFYQAAAQAGVLPLSALDYTDSISSWQAYRESRAALAVAPLSVYLEERARVASTSMTLIPNRDGISFALATGWAWCLVASPAQEAGQEPTLAPAGSELAVELLEWLSDPAFAGEWTRAARTIPAQTRALDQWASDPDVEAARQAATFARLRPSPELIAVLGPALQEAVQKVITGLASPLPAAEAAASRLAGP